MAEGNNNNNHINPPPPQSVPGVVLYHEDPAIDERIRQVRRLHEGGVDVDTIAKAVGRSKGHTYAYLRQIRMARLAYIEAFPEEFACDTQALHSAILERHDLDALLRQEITKLQGDPNPSNRVGVFKLVMRNLRETEELAGLLIQRIEHGGEIQVKDQIKTLLDSASEQVREDYLDALSAVIASAQHAATAQQPDSK